MSDTNKTSKRCRSSHDEGEQKKKGHATSINTYGHANTNPCTNHVIDADNSSRHILPTMSWTKTYRHVLGKPLGDAAS